MHLPPREDSACTAGSDEEAVCSISEDDLFNLPPLLVTAIRTSCYLTESAAPTAESFPPM